MSETPQPPESGYTNPDGTVKPLGPDDPPMPSAMDPTDEISFQHRDRSSVFKCKPDQAIRNHALAIEELYNNFYHLINNIRDLTVRNDDATVVLDGVNELVAGCMNVEDLEGNTARITPKVAEFFKAPPAGIAACTTTTVPNATCTKCEIQSGVMVTTSDTATVYNVGGAITGDAIFMAHKVYGCIWATMSCCENTTITPTGSGSGGSTDPPSGQFNCSFCNTNTSYHQYDLKFYGLYKLVPVDGEPDSLCCDFPDIVTAAEPYTIRVTETCIETATDEGYCQPVPYYPRGICYHWLYEGDFNIIQSCSYQGLDYSARTTGDNPRQCQPVQANMVLFSLESTQSDSFTKMYDACGKAFDTIDPSDWEGIYLWVGLGLWGGNEPGRIDPGRLFFEYVERIGTSPSPAKVDCDFSAQRLDINKEASHKLGYDLEASYQLPFGAGGNRCAQVWPKAWANDEADQAATYVTVTKVESGGVLSV